MRLTTLLPFVLAALAALPLPAAAQASAPLAVSDGALVVDALGHRLALPMPDWVVAPVADTAQLTEQISSTYFADDLQASIELFPRGESEAFWTTLYGIRLNQGEDMSLVQLRQAVVNVYARACQPQSVALFQFEADNGDDIPPLGFVCGAYLNEIPAYAGRGEIMVIGFYRTPTGVGMVYQEWRGAAFDPEDPATWPVGSEVIEARMAQLRSDVRVSAAD
ncbi:MAG: hypothetical protein KIT02_15185 [Devosia sp.]|uniref:hypothetical protein n=1 Tax=Devosia sp. TaxID=1871048 RepID=UPI0024C581F7|nr:hypothetical protein [Devosia sp.]UYN99245.1 MAG: hypothetical protein KIT02_15185 [Devosia sp.]